MDLPTLSAMVELYGSSMALTLEARQFLVQVENLKRLSLNAEILSVKAEAGGEVFQSLAREIGWITGRAREVVGHLQLQALGMAARAIRTASKARDGERLRQGLERSAEGPTRTRIASRVTILADQVHVDVGAIEQGLREAIGTLDDIDRLHLQIPMIATLLKIEARRDASTDPALADSAQELLALRDRLADLLESVRDKSGRTLQILSRTG